MMNKLIKATLVGSAMSFCGMQKATAQEINFLFQDSMVHKYTCDLQHRFLTFQRRVWHDRWLYQKTLLVGRNTDTTAIAYAEYPYWLYVDESVFGDDSNGILEHEFFHLVVHSVVTLNEPLSVSLFQKNDVLIHGFTGFISHDVLFDQDWVEKHISVLRMFNEWSVELFRLFYFPETQFINSPYFHEMKFVGNFLAKNSC